MDLKLFFMTFFMLFFAELGDKTQLAVFSLVTPYKKPMPIFLGASLALILATFVCALFGDLISRHIPPVYLRLLAGVLFVGIGAFILIEAVPGILSK